MNAQRSPQFPSPASQRSGIRRLLPGDTDGNARLTSLAGLLIFVLLAAEGVTVLDVRGLFTPHAFIGLLLIPPVGLKLASTGYRFLSYYGGRASYRIAGPPHPIPRVLAPFLVAATVALFGSGVVLLLSRPGEDGGWRTVHSAAFFVWFWLMSAHVLIYGLRALSLSEWDTFRLGLHPLPGVVQRRFLVTGSAVLGLALAIAFLPWDSTWSHWLSAFHPEQ